MSQSVDLTKLGDGIFAHIKTTRGDIVASLAFELAPLTVNNFVGLAQGTLKNTAKEANEPYYDGIAFHRVVPGFVVQGGDPLGNGRGGPGYQFDDEFDASLRHDKEGILSMANSGPTTNGSQFFITLAPTPHLDDKHSIFGNVVQGMGVVMRIKQGDEIDSVTIIRNGSAAQEFKTDQESFDSRLKEARGKLTEKRNAEIQKQEAHIVKMWPDTQKSASGIRYCIQREGSGKKPKQGDTILVHYTGKFVSGGVFDSSVDRNEPFELQVGVGMVIAGWDESLLDMQVCEKRTVIIPPDLAYGERGAGGVIPPGATLVFDVELLSIQ